MNGGSGGRLFKIAAAALLAGPLLLPVLLAPPLFVSGCVDDGGTAPEDTVPDGTFPVDSVPGVSLCRAAVTEHADEGADHAVPCAQVAYNANPPTSGTHYSGWAAYKTYADPVPEGFLVHSLEHGAIVIGYRCPEGCADEVATVQAWIDRLPGDALCAGARPKIILAPNPSLDARWAAAAWNWSWKAPCADTATLSSFHRARYGRTAEAGVCGGGSDLSTVGWCPAPE